MMLLMNPSSPRFGTRKEWLLSGAIVIGAVLVSWMIFNEPYSKWFGPNADEKTDEQEEQIADDTEYTPPEEISQEPVTIEEIGSSTLRAYVLLKDNSLVNFETKLEDGVGTALVCAESYKRLDFPGGSFSPPYEDSPGVCPKDTTPRSIEVALDLETLKVGEVEWNGYGAYNPPFKNAAATGVVTIKHDGGTERFLLLFQAYRNTDHIRVSSESFGKSLNDLIVDSIDFENGGYLVLNAHSPAGQQVSTPFLVEGPPRHADVARIVELTPNRSSKIYEDHLISFSYPVLFSTQHRLWYGYPTRYEDYKLTEMEKANGKSPIYYSGACEQEPSLADISFGFYSNGNDSSKILTAHFLSSPSVFLTTAPYGYNPDEWGKIIGTLDVTTYAKWVKDGVKIPGKNVEILNIAGYTVRRITYGPQPRPCDNYALNEQYQWVQDGTLFNMISSSRKQDEPIYRATDEAFVEEIIKSVVVK